MEPIPWLWFGLSATFGVLFWAFLLWLAWMLVSSVKGMREELERIRKLMEADRP